MAAPRRRTPNLRRGVGSPFKRLLAGAFKSLVFLGLFGGVAYAFYGYIHDAGQFRVRQIHVSGTEALEHGTVIAQSGITPDTNVLFLDTDAAAARVEALPYVAHCKVERSFPDTVSIEIEERAATATLLVDNHTFLLDPTCVVLRELAPDELHTGPLITEVPGLLGALEPGRRLEQAALAGAMAVWRAFQQSDVGQSTTVSEMAALRENDIRMYCNELPFEIRWGRGNYAAQAARLDVLWRSCDGPPPCSEYLDLRFDNDLACK